LLAEGLTAWDIATDKINKEILGTLLVLGIEVQVNLKDVLIPAIY
jgi:hypothetical protein